MTLLEKIDSVLKCLYDHSGENPNSELIRSKLKDFPIDIGEIRDILMKLTIDGLIYCEINGQIGTVFYDNARYLISFEGKFFYETVGSFSEKMRRDNAEDNRVKSLASSQQIQSEKLTTLTRWISVATCVAAIYYLLEIIKMVYKYLN